MSTLSEQLLSLALTPVWQPSVESDNTELLAKLNTAEQALLREKIICFIVTPEPEEPQQPEPDEPDTPEQVPEEVSFNVKLAC
jgi:hypothetical protein